MLVGCLVVSSALFFFMFGAFSFCFYVRFYCDIFFVVLLMRFYVCLLFFLLHVLILFCYWVLWVLWGFYTCCILGTFSFEAYFVFFLV